MKIINLFLADINVFGNTSGVDRYMSVLTENLKLHPFINVCRIHFRYDSHMFLWYESEDKGYKEIFIPMPQTPDEMITEKYWTERYNVQAYHILAPFFQDKENIILHLHTLNLMNFALLVKARHKGCKIITHLHCIPWKSFLNSDIRRFNKLYKQFYIDKDIPSHKDLVSNHCEALSYSEADHIVCVTHCAKFFLQDAFQVPAKKISVIYNGINDLASFPTCKVKSPNRFRFLYVGAVIPSKGLDYILKALRRLSEERYKVSLTVAGKGQKNYVEHLKAQNKDLEVAFMGQVSFEELKEYYQTCDAGIIASMQEQCSYVAIEMAMFGLPIITTEVDGLGEMFENGVNALKVPVKYSKVYGLSVDVDYMTKKMKEVIENVKLRKKLKVNVRKLFIEKFGVDNMMKDMLAIYDKLIK